MKIDAHQHFWQIANPFTGWPTPDLDRIYCNFLPDNLAPLIRAGAVDGTVLVQAAPSFDETLMLLSLADETPFVRAVVGWIDFESPDALTQLASLLPHPKFRGLRPMLQGMTTRGWILQSRFEAIFKILSDEQLRFDALVRRDQIDEIAELAAVWPSLGIVLDHGGKPAIGAGEFDGWAADIRLLASRPNCFCKLSGLWTEADGKTDFETIMAYAGHLIDCFGPDRLMWGSDWPVIGLAGSYGDWLTQAECLTAHLEAPAINAIFGGTAARFYGISND